MEVPHLECQKCTAALKALLLWRIRRSRLRNCVLAQQSNVLAGTSAGTLQAPRSVVYPRHHCWSKCSCKHVPYDVCLKTLSCLQLQRAPSTSEPSHPSCPYLGTRFPRCPLRRTAAQHEFDCWGQDGNSPPTPPRCAAELLVVLQAVLHG
jgi:hypothetical protein